MHKLQRPSEPDSFLEYRVANPDCRDWDVFRSTTAYAEAKKTLIDSQSNKCAYCEMELPESKADVRIEHFHKKSDPDPLHNWMLDWDNLLVVCLSAANVRRSCDVAKDEVQVGNRKVNGVVAGYAIDGYILNPYEMPEICLFDYDRCTGKVSPNIAACNSVTIQGNKFSTVADLVCATIQVLNLNCETLCAIRKAVNYEYERCRRNLKENATGSIREEIARKWFGNGRVMSMYTTRRILLGKYAEQVIGC